jgi:hypothetical protein
LIDRRNSELDQIDLLFKKVAKKLSNKRRFFDLVKTQTISLSNSIRIENITTQQRFSKIDLIKIVIVNDRSNVKNNLTNFHENVEFLRIMIFINFWFRDLKISFSFHVLFTLNQWNVFDLIIVNVLKMNEKSENKRKSIFVFLFFHKQNLFCLLCFFLIAKKRWYSSSRFFSFWLNIDVILSTKTWLMIDVFSRPNSLTCWTICYSDIFDEIIISEISFFEKMFEFCVFTLFWLRIINEIITDFIFLFKSLHL